jgi:hypothetical protein
MSSKKVEQTGHHGFGGQLRKSDAVAEQQDAPKEEAIVETIGALVDKYGDWHLAVGRR